MCNEEIIEQQNAYYMAGYPSRRSERKIDNVELEKESKTEIVSSKGSDDEKAKEYAIGRTNPYLKSVKGYVADFVLREVEGAFLAGLNVYKPKWHKVADGDLPKEKKEYWCKVFYYESEKTFNAFLWYDPSMKDFRHLENIGEDVESIFKVKEWCELPEE